MKSPFPDMQNHNLNRYCRTPLTVFVLVCTYIYACLPQLDTLPLLPHLIPLGFVLLYWKFHLRWSKWVTRVLTFIACTTCGYVTWQYFGLLNGIDPGTTLLSAAVIMKFTELKTFRDYFLILLINLYILNTNFLYSLSYPVTVYVLAGNLFIYYLLVAVSSAWQIQPVFERSLHSSMAMLGSRLPGLLSANLRHWRTSGQLRYARTLTAWVMVVSLPLAVVIFLAYPRLQLNIFNLQKSTARALTGFSPYMEPGRFTELLNDGSLAFRVKFAGTPPPQPELYWRALTLEDYAGGRWNTRSTAQPMALPGLVGPAATDLSEAISSRPDYYAYEMIVPDHRSTWLFSLDHPVNADNASIALFVDAKGQISTTKSPGQAVSYDVRSLTQLRYAGAWEKAVNLRLPPNEGRRARQLAAQWQGSAHDKLAQGAQWLKAQNFIYSATVADMSVNTIDRFLFEERKGYCEYFASSFAYLMRAAGVPARVVIGYQGGRYSEAGSTVRVYQYAAHAWVEVLLPAPGLPDGYYWQRFDPTAVAEPRRLLESAPDIFNPAQDAGEGFFANTGFDWARWTRDIAFEMSFIWDKWVLSYSGDRQTQLLDLLRANNQLWLNVLFIVSVMVLASLLIFRYGSRRLSGTNDPMVRLLDDFRAHARRLGLVALPSQGCQTIAGLIITHLKTATPKNAPREESAQAATDFSTLWQRTRYRCEFDTYTPADKGQLKQLRQILRRLRKT
ncbi:MAG: DUF3488 and transglutaminase-like domain-containing protein [Proteobacteria bacterium]|nr:DUF3488 and transglutaminase-like domain-containing protein [Pseudomonadota bacterium]